MTSRNKRKRNNLCNECGNDEFVDDAISGDLVCTSCGLVKEGQRIDERPEWRSFTDDDKGGRNKERAGGINNPLLDDGGIATTISMHPGTYHLARAQAMLKDPNKRLKTGFAVIRDMCEKLKLKEAVKDRSCVIFKGAEKYLKERKIHESCAACVYIACRVERCPRTFKEITAVAKDTNMILIMRCFKTITKKLEIQHNALETVKASDYIDRFCSNLHFSKLGTKVAKHIAEIASNPDKAQLWDGKSPISVAAGTLMFVSQLSPEDSHITPAKISAHTGSSVTAMKSALITLQGEASTLVPQWFVSSENLTKLVKKEQVT